MGSTFALRKDELDAAWPKIEPLLRRINEEAWDAEEVKDMFSKGEAQIWGIADAKGDISSVWVMRVDATSRKKWGFIWLCAGDGIEDMRFHYDAYVEPWFRSQGCDFVQINGRRGWQKVLSGFKETGAILVKRLN